MSVANFVRSAASGKLWSDRDRKKIQDIEFEQVHPQSAESCADSDVEEAVASAVPSTSCFSVGGEGHLSGTCKPCAFFHAPQGCDNGPECLFCHQCPPREKQRRKRIRRRMLRECRLNAEEQSVKSGHSRQSSATSSISTCSGNWSNSAATGPLGLRSPESTYSSASWAVPVADELSSVNGCSALHSQLPIPVAYAHAPCGTPGVASPSAEGNVSRARAEALMDSSALGYHYVPALHSERCVPAHYAYASTLPHTLQAVDVALPAAVSQGQVSYWVPPGVPCNPVQYALVPVPVSMPMLPQHHAAQVAFDMVGPCPANLPCAYVEYVSDGT